MLLGTSAGHFWDQKVPVFRILVWSMMLGEKHQGTEPNKAPVAAFCGCRSADSLKRHHSACKNRMKEEAN